MKKLSRKAEKIKNSIIEEYGIVDVAGLAMLQSSMEGYDLWHECQRVVDKDGLTVRGDRGQIKSHPLLATIRDAKAGFLAGLKALNLDLNIQKEPGRPPGV